MTVDMWAPALVGALVGATVAQLLAHTLSSKRDRKNEALAAFDRFCEKAAGAEHALFAFLSSTPLDSSDRSELYQALLGARAELTAALVSLQKRTRSESGKVFSRAVEGFDAILQTLEVVPAMPGDPPTQAAVKEFRRRVASAVDSM